MKMFKYLNKLLLLNENRALEYQSYEITFKKIFLKIICLFIPSKSLRKKIRNLEIKSTLSELKKKYQFNKIYKERSNKNIPLKIVFLVHLPSSWDVFASIYDECVKDDMIIPYIVSIPRAQAGQYADFRYNEENYNFFKEKGIEVIKGYDEINNAYFDLKNLSPDAVFVQTPYDDQRSNIYEIKNLNKFSKVCYLQYAFIITSGDFEPKFYNTAFHENCWLLFAETDYHKNLYKKYNGSWIENKVVVSGYPKFDCYLRDLNPSISIWNLDKNINPNSQRVIWCPHWTINDVFDSSNFLQYYKFFLNLAQHNLDIDLVIRPHPLLLDELICRKHLSRDELDSYIYDIEKLPNAKIDNRQDYFDLFRTSDLLISDNSSFLAEYLPTKKPIIYTHHYKNNSVNLNDYGINLTKYHYIATNITELNGLINRVLLNRDDYNKEKRIKNMEEQMPFLHNHSGFFIKEHLKKSFKL